MADEGNPNGPGVQGQQSAPMIHGGDPQTNAYNEGLANSNAQNEQNNATTGGRRRASSRRARRSRKSRKSRKINKSRRARKGKKSRRARKGKKGNKKSRHTRRSKKHYKRRNMRGGTCPEGFVEAVDLASIAPDRSGGTQTIAHQSGAAQLTTMQGTTDSTYDNAVAEPPTNVA